jgi:hypothetical protein
MMARLGIALAMGAWLPVAALAQSLDPRVCPTAASTVAFDLGQYRGAYLVTNADGSILGHEAWHSCPIVNKGPKNPWDGCNFSLCDMADGAYVLRLADPPAAPAFAFRIRGGMLDLTPTDAGTQVGNYGVDATGGHKRIAFDLQGYALNWSISHWPGPFTGGETQGRAYHDAGKLLIDFFPGGPYNITLGGAHAALTVDATGALSLTPPGGPLGLQGNAVWLRGAAVTIMPPDSAPDAKAGDGKAWSIGGVTYHGPQTLMLPAGAKLGLTLENGTSQALTLDAACHPSAATGDFKVQLAAGADPSKTCP